MHNSQMTEELYQIELESIGSQGIRATRLIRESTGLGLKDAKDLRDSLGVVQSGLTMHECLKLQNLFNALGVKVNISSDDTAEIHNDFFERNPFPDVRVYIRCPECGSSSFSEFYLLTSGQRLNCKNKCKNCGYTWSVR